MVVIVDGGILSAILRVLTRYSANDPQFPVNDWSLFTGKSHAIGGADDIRVVQFTSGASFVAGLALAVIFLDGDQWEIRGLAKNVTINAHRQGSGA